MPAELRLTADQFALLRAHLLPDDAEHAAMLVCGTAGADDLLLCRRIIPVTPDDLESAGPLHLHISPMALARAAKQARNEHGTLVVCHSHPFPGTVRASAIDLETESELCGRVLPGRLDRRAVGALIVGPDGHDGRLWRDGIPRPLALTVGGRRYDLHHDISHVDDRAARQLVVWGSHGQRRIQDARVAVVGVGGTGSHVVTQLAHLGVGHLVLIDDDVVERSNLSRLVGSGEGDLGRAKVDVLADTIARVRPETTAETMRASVVDIDAARLSTVDVLACCTDGHGSRALLTELAAQYLLPLVDLGIEIQAGSGRTTRAGGGVRVMRPGQPCLHCMGVLDAALVREEFLSDDERRMEQARGYLRGVAEPAPSVVSLNGVVASLAVVEIIDILLGVFSSAPARLLYRGESRAVTTATTNGDPACFVCGDRGIVGLGDARPLPRRHHQPRAGSA